MGRDVPDPARRDFARGNRRTLGLPRHDFDFFGRFLERTEELPFLANQVEVLVELLVAHHQELRQMVRALFHEEVDVLEARDGIRPALLLANLIHPFLNSTSPDASGGSSRTVEADPRSCLELFAGLSPW